MEISHKALKAESSFMVMIDLQERLMPAIHDKDSIIENSLKLLNFARELSIPLIVTEQYPKGIGHTIQDLRNLILENSAVIEKISFSCFDVPEFVEVTSELKTQNRDTIILFGVETHICVLATAIAAMQESGLRVVIAADACGSRTEKNHSLGLEAARSLGCLVVPVETIVYHILGKAGTPEFKALLPLFK